MSSLNDRIAALALSDKPSLRGLAYVLRHRDMWPADFEWGYTDCETCAIGLAGRLWGLALYPRASDNGMMIAKVMGTTYVGAALIFFNLRPVETISPDDVADAIDRYLEPQALSE